MYILVTLVFTKLYSLSPVYLSRNNHWIARRNYWQLNPKWFQTWTGAENH